MSGRKKGWVFTIYAGDATLTGRADACKEVECEYMVFQEEKCPDTGRHHLQGWVYFKNARSFQAVKNTMPQCNLEMQRGTNSQAADYCKKADSRVRDGLVYEAGTMPGDAGRQSSLGDACACVKESGMKRVWSEMPEQFVRNHTGLGKLARLEARAKIPRVREVKVYYVWGETGCGKSWWAEHFEEEEDECYSMGDDGKGWFGNYEGERTLIIEEFMGKMEYRFFLRLLDGYKMDLDVKGAHVPAAFTTLILTSNQPPSHCYISEDAWGCAGQSPLERRLEGRVFHGVGKHPATAWTPALPGSAVEEAVEEQIQEYVEEEEDDERFRDFMPASYEPQLEDDPFGADTGDGEGDSFGFGEALFDD